MCGSSVTVCNDNGPRRWSVDSDRVIDVVIPLAMLGVIVVGLIVLIGAESWKEGKLALSELLFLILIVLVSGSIIVALLILLVLAFRRLARREAPRGGRYSLGGDGPDRHYTPDGTFWRPRVGWSAGGLRPTRLRPREQDPDIRLTRPSRSLEQDPDIRLTHPTRRRPSRL
jgi:hypothetical protein